MYRNNTRQPLIWLVRVLLALVFIFSGFVKAVDPWGTAIKFAEYFNAFGMEWLDGAKYALSIALSSLELTMGLLLLMKVRIKTVALLALLFIVGMTVVTLISAITNPVSDCGCFGDAVKLTNWQTFFKNVALLVMAVLLVVGVAGKRRGEHSAALDLATFVLSAAVSVGIGLYSIMHLPIIDFLPFKTGVNIPLSMTVPQGAQGEYETVLVYKNLHDGTTREFDVDDTTWYDSSTWEFVDSRSTVIREGYAPPIGSFSIFGPEGDATHEILNAENEVFLFTVDDLSILTRRDGQNILRAMNYAQAGGNMAVCATTSPLGDSRALSVQDMEIPLYNIDATTLKTMIRAHKGLIILDRGTVAAKWNLKDVPEFRNAENMTPAGYVISRYRNLQSAAWIAAFAVAVILLMVMRIRR